MDTKTLRKLNDVYANALARETRAKLAYDIAGKDADAARKAVEAGSISSQRTERT